MRRRLEQRRRSEDADELEPRRRQSFDRPLRMADDELSIPGKHFAGMSADLESGRRAPQRDLRQVQRRLLQEFRLRVSLL